MNLAVRLPACLLVLTASASLYAQGYRVEGQIYRIDNPDPAGHGTETRLSSSVTLFHNGRVYDYVESADEVIIFEPTARRFTILNTARELVTNADFDEIRHLMTSRRKESHQYLKELAQSGRQDADRISRNLQFQLAPKFQTEFDAAGGQLTMTSDAWKYRVRTHAWQDADQIEEYLEYADWIAQLNYILHPSSMFPEPRMELNRKLRELHRMPTSVVLDLNPQEPLMLRADHKFIAQLTADDRHLIQVWDAAVRTDSLRRLSLRRYQEAVLVSQR